MWSCCKRMLREERTMHSRLHTVVWHGVCVCCVAWCCTCVLLYVCVCVCVCCVAWCCTRVCVCCMVWCCSCVLCGMVLYMYVVWHGVVHVCCVA